MKVALWGGAGSERGDSSEIATEFLAEAEK